jgi:uncharacterized protein with FMN-binding domain
MRRRAPIVLSATAAGLAGLLTFHTHRPVSKVAVGGSSSTTTPATPAAPSTSAPTTSAPTTSAPATAAPAGTTPAAPTTPGSAATTPTASAPSGTRSATGQVETYRYGELSVTVTKSNGRITDAEMASLSETDPRSVQIDNDAIPQLRQEVLDAQSANIDGVSGATFTSQAYAASVQSALDQLGSS